VERRSGGEVEGDQDSTAEALELDRPRHLYMETVHGAAGGEDEERHEPRRRGGGSAGSPTGGCARPACADEPDEPDRDERGGPDLRSKRRSEQH